MNDTKKIVLAVQGRTRFQGIPRVNKLLTLPKGLADQISTSVAGSMNAILLACLTEGVAVLRQQTQTFGPLLVDARKDITQKGFVRRKKTSSYSGEGYPLAIEGRLPDLFEVKRISFIVPLFLLDFVESFVSQDTNRTPLYIVLISLGFQSFVSRRKTVILTAEHLQTMMHNAVASEMSLRFCVNNVS